MITCASVALSERKLGDTSGFISRGFCGRRADPWLEQRFLRD
jgi:hypothetical protein